MAKGKLIVLEGIDGSGKSTQDTLLQENFRQAGILFHSMVFPRYQEPSSALIRLYLSGAFGSRPEDVNACAASAFYAVDRYASYKQDWGGTYEAGGLILADRYTTSNAVHQGCKLPPEELGGFLDWLNDFEYNRLGLPAPDLVIYLDVDIEIALSRIRRRAEAMGESPDIHEKNENYLRRCLATGRRAAAHYGWHTVLWDADGRERDAKEKSEEIFTLIKKQGLI